MTQRLVDGVDVETSDCGLHECFLMFIDGTWEDLREQDNQKSSFSEPAVVSLCFSEPLFLGRVARALGDPRRP